MQEGSIKKNIPILIHILTWTLIGSFFILSRPFSSDIEWPKLWWIKQLLTFFLWIIAFYFNYFILIPKFLFTNRISAFLITNFIACIVFTLILVSFDEYFNMSKIMHETFRPNVPHVEKPRNWYWDIINIFTFAMSVGISTSIAVVQKWQSDEKIRFELERQRTNSELSYLKAQINPHFFFNTLNNIYSLTNIDVEKAKTALLKLSRMMRYVLYETEKNHTLLTKELDFIKDFIELMKMRLTSRVKLDINLPEKIEEAEIAPMLLLPFIENCFKHGISSQKESSILISLEKKGNELTLKTQNMVFKSNENTPEGSASGIGLTNTMRRLDLLYPERYNLHIDNENPENEYRIELNLKLK